MFDKKDNSPKPVEAAAPAPYRAPDTNEVSDSVTSISSSMTIVGKIAGEGTIKVFGRVEGEISATSVLVCADAHVEGNINAQDLTVGGTIKGTMEAQRVKLLGTANVEGDIFHQSLTIEENAKFEGSSRRKENMSGKTVTPAKSHNVTPFSPTQSSDTPPAHVAEG